MDYQSVGDWRTALASLLKTCESLTPGVQPLRERLESDTSLKEVADFGFLSCKTDDNLSWLTRDIVWWASQALKKFRGCGTPDTDVLSREAIQGFLDRNLAVKGILPWWPLRDSMRELLNEALPYVEPSEAEGRFGPGAVAEGFDALQRWSALESCPFDPRDPASCLPSNGLCHLYRNGFLGPLTRTPEPESSKVARLVAVPKDAWRMRLITVEPAHQSFFQQWVRSLLLEAIHRGILRNTPSDFLSWSDNVEKQRRRCVDSSWDLRCATIDLKDASDHISAEAVFDVFPPWVIPWLEMCRTPYVRDGENLHELWMYGGMGNATTFLVETLFFWAFFEAAGRYLRIPARCSVFGDDVVLNERLAEHPLLLHLCEKSGIILNRDKSCYGPGVWLREACGMVAYKGVPLQRLIRINAPGEGTVGRCSLCGLANRLELGLPIQQHLAEDIRASRPEVPIVYARTDQVSSSFGREEIWPKPDVDVFLVKGNPQWNLVESPSISRYLRDQRVAVRCHTISGTVRRVRRAALDPWQGLGVVSGRLSCGVRRRGGYWVEIPVPVSYQTRATRYLLYT